MFAAILVLSAPALAQNWSDNKIRVIQDDGTVQEVEIPLRKKEAEKEEQESAKPYIVRAEPDVEPEAEKVAKAHPAPPRVLPEPVPDVPMPSRKPYAESQSGEPVEEGTVITKKIATAIALEIAPPSRSLIVQNRVMNERPVYAVIFKTEDGPYEILVDGLSGKVLAAP